MGDLNTSSRPWAESAERWEDLAESDARGANYLYIWYDTFKLYKVKYKFVFSNNCDLIRFPGEVALFVWIGNTSNDTITTDAYQKILELPGIKYRMLSAKNAVNISYDDSGGVNRGMYIQWPKQTITGTFNCKKVAGINWVSHGEQYTTTLQANTPYFAAMSYNTEFHNTIHVGAVSLNPGAAPFLAQTAYWTVHMQFTLYGKCGRKKYVMTG